MNARESPLAGEDKKVLLLMGDSWEVAVAPVKRWRVWLFSLSACDWNSFHWGPWSASRWREQMRFHSMPKGALVVPGLQIVGFCASAAIKRFGNGTILHRMSNLKFKLPLYSSEPARLHLEVTEVDARKLMSKVTIHVTVLAQPLEGRLLEIAHADAFLVVQN